MVVCSCVRCPISKYVYLASNLITGQDYSTDPLEVLAKEEREQYAQSRKCLKNAYLVIPKQR